MRQVEITPRDEHNRRLLANVRPADWQNPEPAGRYNLVVIGAGTGGLVSAAVAAGLGARVALIERHLLGGDCLNVGCVPSKALIHAAARGDAGRDGLEYMRRVRAQISHEDSAQRYRDELGVEVFLGDARFTGRDRVEVDGTELRFARAVIATGARAAAPPIPGLEDTGFLTNETVFNLDDRPRRLAVIGGGPIGCELAQAFQRLGSGVTLFHNAGHVLNREDPDAAALVQDALLRDGVRLVLGCATERVAKGAAGKTLVFRCGDGPPEELAFDEVLVAAGRTPNVEGLGLEAAGVAHDPRRGIRVDDRLRTTNRRIYGVGDCCMQWKFTHAADAAAKIAVQNALFFGRRKLSSLVMPWVTYTSPEIAHVGLYERDARRRGVELDTYQVPLERVNRAVTDDQTHGFAKIHVRRGTDRILGATIVAAHAGDLITQLTTAIAGNLGLRKLAEVIHPYPTQSEVIKAAANAHQRSRLTPGLKRLLERWMSWRRGS